MFNSLKIVYRLFRNSFFLTAILYMVALVIVLCIVSLKTAYKNSLQNEFATKQPHITIKYIDENEYKPSDLKYIKSLSSEIKEITPFISATRFFSSTASKIGAMSQYNGDIKVIGMGYKELVYDFYSIKYGTNTQLEVKYTPLEMIYRLRLNPNSIILNKSLFNQYYPVLESVSSIYFKNQKATFLGTFDDYDKTPILYTTIPFAKKLLHKNNITGFFVNAKNLNDITKLTKLLKSKLKDKFIVKSWLESRHKQFMMFSLYEILSMIIIGVILLLSILFILLLLYNAIIKKSYQLSVLFTIGFPLKRELFLFLFGVVVVVDILVSIFIFKFIPYIVEYLHLPFTNDIFILNVDYMFILSGVFLLVSYILIDSSYKLKAKSIF